MINTVDDFIEEFIKHKDKVEWYLHQPTPFADHTDIRGRDVLCSPLTVMCTPPVHHYIDYLELEADIDPSFMRVISNASDHKLKSLEEAIEKYPIEVFPQSRAREALELRAKLLHVLGLTERDG
jgi:hypothetical protein